MKFSTKEDVDVPIAAAFEMISDFDAFERTAIRRGAEVQRSGDSPVEGISWRTVFKLRGRKREVDLVLSEYDSPLHLAIAATAKSMTGDFRVDLQLLTESRTRITVMTEMTPTNLSGRLLVQSLKLAKASLTKRFKLRVAEYAKEMEDRHAGMS